jgi:amino acid transporter
MFYNATKSLAATDVMTAIMIVNLTASSVAVLATASRQLWAFARNKGLPFSTWLAPTQLPKDLPLNALFISLCFTICLSLINIGSSAALNAIFSLNTSALVTSYLVTIGSTIYHRLQGRSLPTSRFSLGKWGLPINILAVCYLIPIYIFSFFPGTPKPTAATMNWGVLMYGAIIIIATIYYILYGRKTFTPPTEEVIHEGGNRHYEESNDTTTVEQEKITLANEKSLEHRD